MVSAEGAASRCGVASANEEKPRLKTIKTVIVAKLELPNLSFAPFFDFNHPDIAGRFGVFVHDLIAFGGPGGIAHIGVELGIIGDLQLFLGCGGNAPDVPK